MRCAPLRARRPLLEDSLRWSLAGGFCEAERAGEGIDFGDFAGGEMKFAGAHHAVDLFRAASSNDSAGNGGIAQRPCDGDFARTTAVPRADFAELFNEGQIFGELGFLEFGIAATEIIRGKGGGALAGHAAGQHTGEHGRINDDANAELPRRGQDIGFDGAAKDGVGRLKRSDGGDLLRALQLRSIEIRDADPADLAFFLQGGERLPSFFETGTVVPRGPVNLVEIDLLDLETAKAVFAFLTN